MFIDPDGFVARTVVDSVYNLNDQFNKQIVFPALDILSLPDKAIDWTTKTTSDERMAWAASSPSPADDVILGAIACLGKLPKVARAITASKGGTETVQRWMSRAELESIQNTNVLSRGGRPGPHYVTDAANSNALRARQRLALPQTPEVKVTLEVPKNTFSAPSKIKSDFNMPGGGLERTAPGHLDIPVTILRVN